MTTTLVNPDRETIRALKELPMDYPVDMLNLIRLRDHAAYEDGRQATGAEAYRAYSKESMPFFQGVGGQIVWSGSPEFMLVGPQGEHWDLAFVARYPTGQAFFDMLYDKGYQAVTYHRTAAVAETRLVRMALKDASGGFG